MIVKETSAGTPVDADPAVSEVVVLLSTYRTHDPIDLLNEPK